MISREVVSGVLPASMVSRLELEENAAGIS
jgi:hypothetical protein